MGYGCRYRGVRTLNGHKCIDISPHEDIEEAFDLNVDPFEINNLARAASQPSWIAELRARLASGAAQLPGGGLSKLHTRKGGRTAAQCVTPCSLPAKKIRLVL